MLGSDLSLPGRSSESSINAKLLLPQGCGHLKETIMRNKDDGKSELIEGGVKDKAWKLINDPDLKVKSETERLNAKIQEKAGKALWKAGKEMKKADKVISGKR